MNDKILAAIEESLPQMQVKAIHDALGELDRLREQNKSDQATIKDLNDKYSAVSRESSGLKDKLQEANKSIEELTVSNIDLKAKDVENRVSVAQAELSGVNTTVDKFLKNTIYRESLQHQICDEYTGVSTQWINGQQQVVPTPGKTHRQVEDTKVTETE